MDPAERAPRDDLAPNDGHGPIRLALVDDYEVVLRGVAHLFDDYRDRVVVVEIDPDEPVTTDVDVALFDTFAQSEADANDIDALIANPLARKVAVYTWCFDTDVVQTALDKGADGYLSKALPAGDMVAAIERVHRGEVVVSPPPPVHRRAPAGTDWPGKDRGLTERESEIIALITQGRRNTEVAAMTYLSINTVKTYIRTAYRKLGIDGRSQAILWGVENGFRPRHHRIDGWAPATADAPGDASARPGG